MSEKILVAIGDSIVNGYWDEQALGWFGRLSQTIAKEFPYQYAFNNLSKGGDTICDAYHRFAYEVFSREADLIIISVGINDILRAPKPSSPTSLSEETRKKYWKRLLDLANKTKAKVVVTDILPVIEEKRNSGSKYNFNTDVIEYNSLIRDICNENNVIFVERFDKWANLDLIDLFVDTVHPNAQGHQMLADQMFGELKKLGLLDK